ncbi:MAG: UvrD-helicase domain-containing protein [Desulfobacterales bacterium]|nr:UvrD-helicase domain-containing protein [Desulfobacterales bacterium]
MTKDMPLSPQQQAAVEYIGSPTLVVAGAGAGKTRTLAAKITHLLQNGYEPDRILAITFTNKAAEEMKNRLVETTGIQLKRFPWVRTYHSACFRIFKQHCERVGYKPPIQIYASYQQQSLLKEILVGELNSDKKYLGEVAAEISNAKNTGHPLSYFDRRPRVGGIRLIDIFNRYETLLKLKNAVDFDNILLLTRNLLRDHEDLREHYRQFFQFILVDEYQDTNDIQESMTRLLVKDGNLFCVGDDWQAIYAFRGSNVDHFLAFSDQYPDARIFRLEQNYRSFDEIVRVANDLIQNNPDRMDKSCFSRKCGGIVELHEFFTEEEEARWTGAKIRSLQDLGIHSDQIAVLYRTKFCSLAFEKAFRSMKIPYEMLGGKGFFERKEILDLNAYIAAAVFPKDDASFERIVNTPRRGIGPGALEKISRMRAEDVSLQEAVGRALHERIFTQKLYQALFDLMQLLEEIRSMKPDAAVCRVLDQTGYLEYLRQYCKGDSMGFIARKENIDQLIYSASQNDNLVD